MISVLSCSPDVLSRLCLMLSDTKLFRKRTLHSGPMCYRPQTKFAQVMFSQVSVCPQGGLSLCPGVVSVQGGSLSRGVSIQGSLSRGSLSGGSLFRGISACWVSVHGGLCHGDTLYGNERAVRILLECILVFHSFIHSSLPLFIRNGFHGASPHLMGVTALSTWRYQVPTGFGIQQVGELE